MIVGQVIVVTGSWKPSDANSIEVISDDLASSQRLPDLPFGFAQHTSALLDGRLTLCGGKQNGTYEKKCYQLHKENGSWTEFLPSMNLIRFNHAVASTPNGWFHFWYLAVQW